MGIEVISTQNVINAQPGVKPPKLEELGKFNQLPVKTVEKPTDCGTKLMTNDAGFYMGLFSSGFVACAGNYAVPWSLWGLGQSFTFGTAVGLSLMGAAPGLACAAGVAVWGCTDGR